MWALKANQCNVAVPLNWGPTEDFGAYVLRIEAIKMPVRETQNFRQSITSTLVENLFFYPTFSEMHKHWSARHISITKARGAKQQQMEMQV